MVVQARVTVDGERALREAVLAQVQVYSAVGATHDPDPVSHFN